MSDTGIRVPYRSAGFMPENLAQRHTQLMHCMARFANAVAFLPLAPQSYSLRTSRNANGLPTCRRMSKYFFFVKLKAEICVLPKGRCMLRSMHPPSRDCFGIDCLCRGRHRTGVDLCHSPPLLREGLMALGVAGHRWRCADLCRRVDRRGMRDGTHYGSSESKPRARARATAWTRLCTPSFSKIWVT
jgi:hypothetical protein